jgi:hypothetical protein
MGKEIEIQVLEVDQPAMERRLKALGAELVMPMTRMVRAVYHTVCLLFILHPIAV